MRRRIVQKLLHVEFRCSMPEALSPGTERAGTFQALLSGKEPFVAAELPPPRAELTPTAGMEAWIDTGHAVRGLVQL